MKSVTTYYWQRLATEDSKPTSVAMGGYMRGERESKMSVNPHHRGEV